MRDQGEGDVLNFDFFLFDQKEEKIQRAFEDVELDPVSVFPGPEGGRPRRLAQGACLVRKAVPAAEKLDRPLLVRIGAHLGTGDFEGSFLVRILAEGHSLEPSILETQRRPDFGHRGLGDTPGFDVPGLEDLPDPVGTLFKLTAAFPDRFEESE
jgi:hypothetical protein